MLKFTLGLTTGIVLGAFGTFAAAMFAIVALEDSPKLLESFRKDYESRLKK